VEKVRILVEEISNRLRHHDINLSPDAVFYNFMLKVKLDALFSGWYVVGDRDALAAYIEWKDMELFIQF
jgi:hypothetical protein